MRAAILYGPEDLRVEDVPEPDGEVIVEVQAATTCGTDVKMWRYGHPVLPPYPCAFGHETAGVRADTGERVLVSDSVACGGARRAWPAGRRSAGIPPGCWAASRERIAAPAAALHPIPDGLPAPRRRWPSRWRRRSTRSPAASAAERRRRARRRPDGADARRRCWWRRAGR